MPKIVSGMILNDDDSVITSEDRDLIEMKKMTERYVTLSENKSKIDVQMKAIKKSLLEKFPSIPDKYKFITAPETVTVAGQSFVKVMKCINFEKVSIIMRQRIDTKLSREGLYYLLERKRATASTDEERKILDDIKVEVDRMLSPHSTDVIEPRKKTR